MKQLINFKNTIQICIALVVIFSVSSCKEDDESPINGIAKVFDGTDVKITASVVYGNDISNHFMDVYEAPSYDQKKPLVLLSGGGNFGNPSKIAELNNLAFGLAQRGYVAAVVKLTQVNDANGIYPVSDYSLDEVTLAFTQGTMDIKAAVRFFRANETEYEIDTENIFVGGWSTGAHCALAAAYIDDISKIENMDDDVLSESYAKAIEQLGGIEGNSGNQGFSSSVKGVIGLMPLIPDLSFFEQGDPSLLLITDEASFGFSGTTQISLIGQVAGTTSDHSYVSYGHNEIANYVESIGLDYEEHLISSGSSKPNGQPISNHNTMATFLANKWKSSTN